MTRGGGGVIVHGVGVILLCILAVERGRDNAEAGSDVKRAAAGAERDRSKKVKEADVAARQICCCLPILHSSPSP